MIYDTCQTYVYDVSITHTLFGRYCHGEIFPDWRHRLSTYMYRDGNGVGSYMVMVRLTSPVAVRSSFVAKQEKR